MGKPSDLLALLPGETVIQEMKGDCSGSFGIVHGAVAGKYWLTNQRILFRGGGIVEATRLVFAVPYTDIVAIEPFRVAYLFPTGIRVVSQKEGGFYLSVMKRKEVMEIIQQQVSRSRGSCGDIFSGT